MKGIGEVILGFVKQGVINTHDTMVLLPADKDIIRSIQMQDKDFDSATAGCRVGLAIKGATIEELKRGAIFSAPDVAKIDTKFTLHFTKNRYYQDVKKGIFHGTIGMRKTSRLQSQTSLEIRLLLKLKNLSDIQRMIRLSYLI